jgi:two-component system cell cycle response regulator
VSPGFPGFRERVRLSSPATVLIADDSPLVLRMIEDLLSRAGFSVVTARDGIEAVDKVFAEAVDLVILDVMMPRMSGYQVCRLLKSEPATAAIPVVILTSRDQAGDRFWGLETGADYYVTKDEAPQRILALVRQITENEGERRPARPPEGRGNDIDVLSRVNDLLDRKLFAATILSEIGRTAEKLDDFEAAFSSLMAIVTRVLDFSVGALAFVEADQAEVALSLQRPVSEAVVAEARQRLLETMARLSPELSADRVRFRAARPAPTGGAGSEARALGGFATFPILADGGLKGLLAVGGRSAQRISLETEGLLRQVANLAYLVAVNARLIERLRHLSVRDSLTDLFNHRHSMELIASEFQRVGRYAGGVSVIMIDIDHFKQVNDEHGHQVGDALLRETARLMSQELRTVDSLGRYGGEEFVAVLPHTDHDEALRIAERLRHVIEDHVFQVGPRTIRITISLGVACFPSPKIDSPSELVGQADRALYEAKQSGRNRVV